MLAEAPNTIYLLDTGKGACFRNRRPKFYKFHTSSW
jgi:hypothetical protein